MVDLGKIELAGTELILRPLEIEHASALATAASESRDTYGYTVVPDGIEDAITYVEGALRQRAGGQRYPFVIIWRGSIVGTTSFWDFQPWEWPAACNLQRQDCPDAVEIGFTWLAQSAQRTSCNTEAKFLMLKHAFETWQVYRVSLRTDERNARSRRAIERIGAKFEGLRRADMPGRDCTVRTSAYFSIVAAEWPEVRERLIRLMARARFSDSP